MARILAVIHHVDDGTTRRNAAVAAAAGFDGVMLIQMEGRDHLLDTVSVALKQEMPGFLVGTNRLASNPADAIRRASEDGLDAAWEDNPGLRSDAEGDDIADIDVALAAARALNPGFLYFGSVAFKTQRRDPDPSEAARRAVARGWIATTSGPATGIAPQVEKLLAMREGAAGGDLAVASGVSPGNVTMIAPLVDWILVATGVSSSFHDLDPDLCSMLREGVNAANSPSG